MVAIILFGFAATIIALAMVVKGWAEDEEDDILGE
jgi:hypothetical protein